jgi:rhodanese-related sulfurtransferase
MPLGQVAGRLRELDRGQTIVVQCQSGARSAKACDILRAQGFVNVLNLRGGMLAWLKLGL